MECKVTARKSHYPKDVPFEVPGGWVWSTLGEYFNLQAGKFISADDIHEESSHYPYRCFGGNGIRGYVATFNRTGDYPIIGRQGALCGNINYASGEFYATEHAVVVESFGGTNTLWARYLLEQLNLNQYATATAQPGLSVKTINEVAIPIPPIGEQQRIAEAINRCIDIINYIRLSSEELQARVHQAKSYILNLAIHGKLVSQDPSEEPAIELLKRINPAFQPSHNLHYEECLPSGWVYATLGEISDYGHCVSVSKDEIAETEWVLELEDIEKDTGRLLKKVIKSERAISGSRHVFYKGQVLYSKLRTYLNKVFVAEDCGFCTTEIIPITPKDGITAEYLNMYLRSPLFLAYTEQCGYGVKMPRLGTSDARKAIVPVPPTMEQHRIVTVTKQLFAQIDALADNL
ncbi:restriction endonuclease subunit S [Candidatus Saccharibacteria bacterium]|nr:restriction endonuclease subunit S [Candidatus Saccharibacteria bacterium]